MLLDADVEPELAEALNKRRMTSEAEAFGQRVLKTLQRIHASLMDFARNEEEQYWLGDPQRPGPQVAKTTQHELMAYDTRLRTPDGWCILEIETPSIQAATLPAGPSGIDQQTWDSFCRTVADRDYRARAHRRLLANANSLFDNGDFRSAVVESIAAWEIVLASDAPRILARYQSQLGIEDWKDLIERAGLRASSRFFLAILSPKLPALASSGESLLMAIEVRNQIVHAGRRRFKYEEVRDLLQAVRGAILACELPGS